MKPFENLRKLALIFGNVEIARDVGCCRKSAKPNGCSCKMLKVVGFLQRASVFVKCVNKKKNKAKTKKPSENKKNKTKTSKNKQKQKKRRENKKKRKQKEQCRRSI